MSASPDLGAVYRTHGELVFQRARRLLGNDAEARDVMQQVFASIVRDPDRFRGDSSWATYLYRATTTTCLQHMRNARTRAGLLAAHPFADAAPPDAESAAIVRDSVAQLDGDVARVVHHAVDGMTYDEMAAELGCSRRRVATLLARARVALAGLAVALALAIVALRGNRDDAPTTRLKGNGASMAVYVAHGGGAATARVASGDTVAPGDTLQMTVTLRAASFVTLTGGDGTVYFAGRMEAGVDVRLPVGIELDDARGPEDFTAQFCDADGCTSDRIHLVKR